MIQLILEQIVRKHIFIEGEETKIKLYYICEGEIILMRNVKRVIKIKSIHRHSQTSN